MAITNSMQVAKAPGKRTVLTGRIISVLCVLFCLFDAISKLVKESHSMKGSVELGWPESGVQGIGVLLLVCTIIYIIPRTAILGAILLTGYMGGAVAIMVRVGAPFYFPVLFGILIWAGLFLRYEKLRSLLPLQKEV